MRLAGRPWRHRCGTPCRARKSGSAAWRAALCEGSVSAAARLRGHEHIVDAPVSGSAVYDADPTRPRRGRWAMVHCGCPTLGMSKSQSRLSHPRSQTGTECMTGAPAPSPPATPHQPQTGRVGHLGTEHLLLGLLVIANDAAVRKLRTRHHVRERPPRSDGGVARRVDCQALGGSGGENGAGELVGMGDRCLMGPRDHLW
jgi:hypothetical protein